jgi:hypothetical protein
LFCGLFGTAFSYTKWLPLNLKVLIPNFPVKSADPEPAPTRSHQVFLGFSSSHPRIALVALSRINSLRFSDLLGRHSQPCLVWISRRVVVLVGPAQFFVESCSCERLLNCILCA